MSLFATDLQISGKDITGVQRMVSQAIKVLLAELRTFKDDFKTAWTISQANQGLKAKETDRALPLIEKLRNDVTSLVGHCCPLMTPVYK